MKKELRITDYLNAHGKAPKGQGCWGFYFDDIDDIWFARNNRVNEIFIITELGTKTPSISMTFSNALKLAEKEAKRRNATVITVAP